MARKEQIYTMKQYQQQSVFSSFLPGISGEKGIPLWCYYVNRGQGIACFGVQDKNHSIMEFYPAHQAYERTPLMGFRTFLKWNGQYEEAFSDPTKKQVMEIGMNCFVIREETEQYEIKVEYETLPEEELAGFMRSVSITNKRDVPVQLEVVDGLSEILPYGVTASTMKEMGQTAKAWMQVLDASQKMPKFKVRASMEDTAQVTQIREMNFAFGKVKGEGLLPVIVDREVLFDFDTTLRHAYGFEQEDVEQLFQREQVTCNDVPSCFFGVKKVLGANETICIQELYGMSPQQEVYEEVAQKFQEASWFEQKQMVAKQLAMAITDRIHTKTGNETFDGYCRQCYLDNLLRGGYPIQISDNQIFYLYSRKHGDMERDYNFFSMTPECYSQGNGNFRDVNQNRRSDILFSPFVGTSNIKTFYNALQINGYNPLGIEKITYVVKEEYQEEIRKIIPLEGEFTPGELYRHLHGKEEARQLFTMILDRCERVDTTKFLEGYWCDHWTYNLDLVELYLAVYPEKKEELLYADTTYKFTQAQEVILPRKKRYVNTEKGIRQYHFLQFHEDTSKLENRFLKDSKGNEVQVNLLSKMFTLVANKISALDPYGMGIEMEGGKPGWYDALNGLPGLLGSSMAETWETYRLVKFLLDIVEETKKEVAILEEVSYLTEQLVKAGKELLAREEIVEQEVTFWNGINDAKEQFWAETKKQVSGNRVVWEYEKQKDVLTIFEHVLQRAVTKAEKINGSVCATYFYYDVTQFEEIDGDILPKQFRVQVTPKFLEGSVHALKMTKERQKQKELYQAVKESALYDQKLKMYKVNASLSSASFELGRACAFTPGWLENESIWLHMEYKYLLELLKAKLYEEFFEDFHNAAIPFLEEQVYGRSLLENSSFIVSSVNPNENIHGKGFVARLSGSTAEFLQIWQIMMFGEKPFYLENDQLVLELCPCIPSYILNGKNELDTTLLGTIPVHYEFNGLTELVPGQYVVDTIQIVEEGKEVYTVDCIKGELAKKVREGKVSQIKVTFQAK